VALGGGAAAVVLGGCTNAALDQPASAATASLTPSGSATESTAASAFPVTVTHRFGETTIPAAPQRIVALGQTDCDPLIALGITPIAVGSFVDDWYSPVNPWNEAGFTNGPPEELNFFEVEFEKVAALKPDLITMVSGGITKDDYKTLSKIAPVVGPPVGYQDSAVPYAAHTALIGQAVGRDADAAQLVADVDAKYAAVRAAHPEWAALTSAHAECWTGAFDVLGANAPRTAFLTAIGFTLPPKIAKLTGDQYSVELSAEELDLVGDLDLVVWCTDEGAVPQLQQNPVVSRLDAVKDGRAIWLSSAKTDVFMWSMDWNTVLSAPFAIETGIPLVEAGLAGESPLSEQA
jgi:iron complex transport system substrate-binding protein